MTLTGGLWRIGFTAVAVLLLAPLPVSADWEEGVAAFQNKDYETAIAEFKKVNERAPDYAGAYYMKGQAELKLGRTSQALASLRKAVELDGNNSTYRIILGQALIRAEQFQDAFSTLREVSLSNVQANNRTTYALLFARAATKAGQPDQAIRVLNSQVQADGRNPNLHQALGAAQDAAGNDSRAYSAFKRAFELDSSNQATGREAIRTAIAAARRASGDQEKSRLYREAGQLAERLVGLSASFDHHLVAGEAWLGAKDYNRALGWFDKAVAQRPKNALVYYYRGQSYSSTNRLTQAETQFQEALKMGPSQRLRGQIYNNLGYVYDKQGKYDDAIRIYREVGNQAKISEMERKKEQQAQNKEADAERRRFQAQVEQLRAQIQELEKLGESEEVRMLREQLAELEKALAEIQQ
jgi:tetratricopeptide (TPR) repeat protein